MEKHFSNLMLERNFREAAGIIYNEALDVNVSKDINLKINIDKDKNLDSLQAQLEKSFHDINDSISGLAFETLWEDIFKREEMNSKQALKTDDKVSSVALSKYNEIINQLKINQYKQIYLGTSATLRTTLQGVIDAAVKI